MILGMPRTGTTFLHRLLSVMPGARKARSWELIQPLPPRRAADERRTQAARQVALARTLAPELDSKHRLGVDEPDECVLLMAPSFHSIAWWMFAPTYGYLDWLLDQDLAPAYAEYHLYLRALQDAEGGRFVLKAPAHTGYLAELAAEIPELVFVQTHRDPATVLASASSLFDSFFSLVTEHHDSQRTARTNLELFLSLDQRCRAARDAGLDDRVLDLRYETIIADPIAAVRQIYAHGDIPWPEGGEAVLRAHLQASGQRRRPKHRYALEDFGLSTDEVHQRFAAYIARYLGSCARQRT
nr:sulfotransferase [Pseudenhygromyxa sp. WMMC2535]